MAYRPADAVSSFRLSDAVCAHASGRRLGGKRQDTGQGGNGLFAGFFLAHAGHGDRPLRHSPVDGRRSQSV